MKKEYDYYLIIWIDSLGAEVHQPACFSVGMHPQEWCELMLDSSNNTRAERSPRYKSFSIYKLEVIL